MSDSAPLQEIKFKIGDRVKIADPIMPWYKFIGYMWEQHKIAVGNVHTVYRMIGRGGNGQIVAPGPWGEGVWKVKMSDFDAIEAVQIYLEMALWNRLTERDGAGKATDGQICTCNERSGANRALGAVGKENAANAK